MSEQEYIRIKNELLMLQSKLADVNDRLDIIGDEPPAIVVKVINDKPYYYEEWRENGKVKNRSLGAVFPVAVSEREQKKIEYKELLLRREELEDSINRQKRVIEAYMNGPGKSGMLDDYIFEVYWKNMLSSRVSVRKNSVKIKRVIVHPLRQLFPSNKISRNRLNEILELRCFDRNRPDAQRKLEALGLSEYRPIDIIRKTHGVSYNDYIWFRFMGENIRAEDVLVRSINV